MVGLFGLWKVVSESKGEEPMTKSKHIVLFAGLEIPMLPLAAQYQESWLFVVILLGYQMYLLALLLAIEQISCGAVADAKKQWDKDLVAFYKLYLYPPEE